MSLHDTNKQMRTVQRYSISKERDRHRYVQDCFGKIGCWWGRSDLNTQPLGILKQAPELSHSP